MHWKCSEIWERKVYWVQFWDLFLDRLNGKILKMAYFFPVSIGVENPEKMCAWKTSLTSFLFSFWKWFFFLSWLWLNYKTFDYTFLKPPFFSFLFAKVIGFFHENCWQEKKKTFVGPWEKLMENYYNCIGVSSIENWKMSSWIQAAPLEKLMEKTERFHARFSFSLLGLGPDWSDLPFSSFFSNIFRDSFTLEKVFPPRSFLSTLLHCLPTFIPTTQKIQMLWCNPKLQTSRGRL